MKFVHQLLFGLGATLAKEWTDIVVNDANYTQFDNATLKAAIQALRNPNDNSTWDLTGYAPSKFQQNGNKYRVIFSKSGADDIEAEFTTRDLTNFADMWFEHVEKADGFNSVPQDKNNEWWQRFDNVTVSDAVKAVVKSNADGRNDGDGEWNLRGYEPVDYRDLGNNKYSVVFEKGDKDFRQQVEVELTATFSGSTINLTSIDKVTQILKNGQPDWKDIPQLSSNAEYAAFDANDLKTKINANTLPAGVGNYDVTGYVPIKWAPAIGGRYDVIFEKEVTSHSDANAPKTKSTYHVQLSGDFTFNAASSSIANINLYELNEISKEWTPLKSDAGVDLGYYNSFYNTAIRGAVGEQIFDSLTPTAYANSGNNHHIKFSTGSGADEQAYIASFTGTGDFSSVSNMVVNEVRGDPTWNDLTAADMADALAQFNRGSLENQIGQIEKTVGTNFDFSNWTPIKYSKQGDVLKVVFQNNATTTEKYVVSINVDKVNPDSIRDAIDGVKFPYELDIEEYVELPTMTAIVANDVNYNAYNVANLKKEFGEAILTPYTPSRFKVNDAANSYTAVYGKGAGEDKEEYEVTFTSGGFSSVNGPPTTPVVTSIEEFETHGRWRQLTSDNTYYGYLTSNTFVTKLQQVKDAKGANWNFDGWVPDRYRKDENLWTAVFKKGEGDKREEAYVRFELDPNKTIPNAFAELDNNDFDIGKFEEAKLPDFTAIGLAGFTTNDAALKATFETDDFEKKIEQELGLPAGTLEMVEPESFKTKTLSSGLKRHTVVIRTGEGQSDLIELIVNEDAAGNYEIIDVQNFNTNEIQLYEDGTVKPAFKELDTADFFYTEFNKQSFKDILKTVAKSGGGNWDLDGYTPEKFDRDGENYTVVFGKGDDEVEVKFQASGEEIETALGNLQAGDFVISEYKNPEEKNDDSATKLFSTLSVMAAVFFMSS